MDFAYVVVPAIFVIIGRPGGMFAVRRMRSLRTAGVPAWRTITVRVILSLVGVAAVLLAASADGTRSPSTTIAIPPRAKCFWWRDTRCGSSAWGADRRQLCSMQGWATMA